ncbi:MAG: hypothetical protein V4577_14310 [Bacteroidota bacterium]
MTTFKLLGIRPMPGCHEKFLKNLNPGEIYRLYRSCRFLDDNSLDVGPGGVVDRIRFHGQIPDDFFDTETAEGYPLKVSISAIAGKNGSGKSSLVELLFAAIYVFSVQNGMLEPNNDSLDRQDRWLSKVLQQINDERRRLDQVKVSLLSYLKGDLGTPELIKRSPEELLAVFSEYEKDEQKLLDKEKAFGEDRLKFDSQRLGIAEMKSQIAVEVYYELNGAAYRLSIGPKDKVSGSGLYRLGTGGGEIVLANEDGEQAQREFAFHFFYTIAVNYSHYALNSNYLGDWINSLFHKNDGYKTPVVINPMRSEGNFDINKEMAFAKYRLLSNVLVMQSQLKAHQKTSKVFINEKHFVKGITFTLNENKIAKQRIYVADKGSHSNDRAVNAVIELLQLYYPDVSRTFPLSSSGLLAEYVMNYIVQKIDRIAENYDEYHAGYDYSKEADKEKNAAFLLELFKDKSHITFKLEQAVHFLYKIFYQDKANKFKLLRDHPALAPGRVVYFELDELLDWMGDQRGADIIRFLPPAIFNIDFELRIGETPARFSELSSGEQQLIHVVQSVVYHLNNIQSVHYSGMQRVSYSAVNIIYDEIELYFHPDYQRRFISELRLALGRVYTGEQNAIQSVNILFLTHSPFILSDIPRKNILLLKANGPRGIVRQLTASSETFAANIHDLLADSFFLEGTLMGIFAEKQITQLIDRIGEADRINAKDRRIVKLIGDSFLRTSVEQYVKKKS